MRTAIVALCAVVLGCTTEPLWDTTMTGRWSGSSTDGLASYRWRADLEENRWGWIRGTYESAHHPAVDSAGWMEGDVFRGWFRFNLYDMEGGTALCEWSGTMEDQNLRMEGWLLCPPPEPPDPDAEGDICVESESHGLLVMWKRNNLPPSLTPTRR